MTKIAILSCSTRIGRQSHRVALALEKKVAALEGYEAIMVDLAAYQIPIFDQVLSRHPNPPADLIRVAQLLKEADAMIFVSPEYNGGPAPALRNLADYLGKTEFFRKAIAVCSVSTGLMGGVRGALQMQQLVLALFAYPIPQMLLVPTVQSKFMEDGLFIDPEFEKKVDTFLTDFVWLVSALEAKRK